MIPINLPQNSSPRQSPLIVGLSGGVDSSTLLHLIRSQYPSIPTLCVHVNHELQDAAAAFSHEALLQSVRNHCPYLVMTRTQAFDSYQSLSRGDSFNFQVIAQSLFQYIRSLNLPSSWIALEQDLVNPLLNPSEDQFHRLKQLAQDFKKNPAFQWHSQSIEAQARAARYWILQSLSILYEAQGIAIAHHANDHQETRLIAYLRGQGVQSLLGLEPQSEAPGMTPILRPLLSYSKSQILEYAQTQQLTWIEDPTNQDPQFRRNDLRLHLIPSIEQSFPQFGTQSRSLEQELRTLLSLRQEILDQDLKSIPINLSRLQHSLHQREGHPPQWDQNKTTGALCSELRSHHASWQNLSELRKHLLLDQWLRKLQVPPSSLDKHALCTRIEEYFFRLSHPSTFKLKR